MAIIKCKMCGGDLILEEGSNVAECAYCGSRQTVPSADNEKKLNLFARANRLRANNEFDKAAGVYESIVADFPEEAEAYWGLILCKYGIEYVDDPATGKKIPTCHRSSFDSVMDDANFELVMENADPIARRVYREEAKQLEELRKGIIEVSSHEEPYDIFICYKETDDKGDRTLDSVLAQDVYDMLTENGYRVFFSRVTLEDKLGQEYEPYIFAALNSAKIMLAFGTDYDYYNAVWVKNEWSRFLQLIAKGEKKTLIPCYKNIDAYDMPKEFAKLQAQDLGKVGANQDLLRGLKKILPKEQPKEAAQQAVVQQSAASGPSTDSLLRRTRIFLEEKNWDSAKEYANKVLDIQPENAEAYLCLMLAEQRLGNLDAFVKSMTGQFTDAKAEKAQACQPEYDRINKLASSLVVDRYLSREKLQKPFEFNLSYSDRTASAIKNKQQALEALKANRYLSRAKQYASGETKARIEAAETAILSACDSSIALAKADAERDKAETIRRYRDHLDTQERIAEEKSEAAKAKREEDYADACRLQEKAETEQAYLEAAEALKKTASYKDSRERIAACQKEAARLKAEREAHEREVAEEAARITKEKAEKAAKLTKEKADREAKLAAEKKKKRTIITIIAATIATLAIAAVIFIVTVIIPSNKYQSAQKLYQEGNYREALEMWLSSGKTKTTPDWIYECWDHVAVRHTISAGEFHVVGIQQNGTVVGAGSNSLGEYNVSGWSGIIDVSAMSWGTVGLRKDGTVVSCGSSSMRDYCSFDDWNDIVSISAGNSHIVGLRSNGTVVGTGLGEGLLGINNWNGIVAVSAGADYTLGLKYDGTVVAVGDNKYGQCNVGSWTDIVAISAGEYGAFGLQKDGSIVVAGTDSSKEKTAGWSKVTMIVSSVYRSSVIALCEDGTVFTDNSDYDFSNWTDIVDISTDSSLLGSDLFFGVRFDGTVLVAGHSGNGQDEAAEWKNMKVPIR